MSTPILHSQSGSRSISDSLCTDERSFMFSADNESSYTGSTSNTKTVSISHQYITPANSSGDATSFEKHSVQNGTPEIQTEYNEMSRHSSLLKRTESSVTEVTGSQAERTSILNSEWFSKQKKEIEKKLLAVQRLKKQRLQDEKSAALRLERTLPMDLLAFDWFNENSLTSELRVYLIDKLLPTLILGIEKVLIEAERKGLIDAELDVAEVTTRFNPINLLAQYLMRNNPRYSNLSESSPYVRGLKKVSQELRRDVFAIEANKLARLKMEAQQKRNEIEERERRKAEDAKERARLLTLQFSQWLVDSGKLQLQLIQNALYSYLEISSHLASDADNVIHYSKELDATDETGKTLTIEEYIKYIEQYVCEMTMKEFIQLLRHLDQCAIAFRKTFEREVWRDMFVKLFNTLDSESSGYIDRHRMLHLLEKFWDKLENGTKDVLHNPRKWPVIELEELDDLYPESDDESGSYESVNVSTEEATSSEWASVPVSGYEEENGEPDEATTTEEEKEEEDAKSAVVLDDGSGEKSVEASPEQVEETLQQEDEVTPANEENDDQERESSVEVDKSSEKVSAGSGADTAISDVIKEEEEKEAISTPKDEEIIPEKIPVDGTVVTDAETKEESVEEPSEELPPKKDVDEAPIDEEAKEEAVDVETGLQPEESSSNDVAPRDDSKQIDAIEDSKPEVEEEKAEMEAAPVSDVPAVEEAKQEETDAKDEAPDVSNLLQAATTSLSATLITPAPSTDGSIDVGPVSINFSKEAPQPKVRKTTSFTTVQSKKPAEEEATTNGQAVTQSVTAKTELPTTPVRDQENKQESVEKDTDTVVTTLAGESEAILVQETAEDMVAGDYYPAPVEVKTRPGSTSRLSVTFAAEPLILPDRPSAEFFSHYSSRSHSRMTSVFDENQLNEGRFVTLLENFTSDETTHDLVENLVNFLHGGYVETEEEKLARLEKVFIKETFRRPTITNANLEDLIVFYS